MNVLKIRKLAAIVAGGALLGAAAAPMVSAITSADAKSVTYNADMSPVVNIVVGQTAAVSDGVWAGNIARKVVEKAVMTKSFLPGQGGSGNVVVSDLSAVLSLGGSVTVTGGKTFDSNTLNSSGTGATEYNNQEIGQDPLAFLSDESVSYKFNGSSTTVDVKETIGAKLDAKFDTDSDIKDLVAKFSASDLNYTLNLGAGIPTNDTVNVVGDFSDDSDDNVRIPFFGKTYLVQTVDQSDSNTVVEVRLIEDKAKQTFVAGESFTMQGKGSYVGQTLTVTLVSVVATGPAAASYQAKFNLTDEAGNLVDTQTVSAGNFVEFEDAEGDDVLTGDIYMDTASVNTGTNEGTVDVLVGTSSVRLLDGQNYPYDEQLDQDNIDGPYVVSLIETASSNRLTQIVIKNRDKESDEEVDAWVDSVFDDENPFYSTDDSLTADGEDGVTSFEWLDGTGALGEGFFKITFNGFEEDEELTYLKIGDNEIKFKDAQDSSHTVPFYMTQSEASSTNTSGEQFTFDGSQELWYEVFPTAVDFNVVDGSILNGATVVVTGGDLQTDNGLHDLNSGAANTVTLGGVTYRVDGNSSTSAHLSADGYFIISDDELDDSNATSDWLAGPAGANNVVGTAQDGFWFYNDANTINATNSAPILFPLAGDNYNVAYAFRVAENDVNSFEEGITFSLAGNAALANTTGNGITIPYNSTMQNSKRLAFVGTDTAEDGTPDLNYYMPQLDDLGEDNDSTTVFTSVFQVDINNGTEYPWRVYFDNQNARLVDTGDDDIADPTADVNYGWGGSGLNGVTFSMNIEDESSSIEKAYDDFGTKVDISNETYAEFWIPENQPQIEFVVTGQSSTTSVEGGEEITVDEGDTGTFTTGTQITVKDITYTATVTGGSDVVTNGPAGTYTTPAPLNGKAQVYTTGSSVPGPKIIVGGPLVNSLAQEVADMLNASGDQVSGVYSGNIIVAGYTAEDTGMAAQDLISALDAI